MEAPVEDYDLVIGYLFLWMAPHENGSALGSRYTPLTLKNLKTKIQTLIIHFLKRSDIDLLSAKMTFTHNMYISKQNKTAEEPQAGNQGDRERKVFTEEDQAKLDRWMTRSLAEVWNYRPALKF